MFTPNKQDAKNRAGDGFRNFGEKLAALGTEARRLIHKVLDKRTKNPLYSVQDKKEPKKL